MSQPPKTDAARLLWETCPECMGKLEPELGGDLVCPKGHYRAVDAATVEWREDTPANPLIADGGDA